MLSEGDAQVSNNKCIEKARTRTCYCGIQTGIEGDGDPSSTTVEDDLVNFYVSLICEEES